tara:strand:+ start:1099 stop:2346 length:1248 start_codon:yes stop_codon:yes gene_type:complete
MVLFDKNLYSLTFEQFFRFLLGFATTIIFARYLGSEGFGIYSYILVIFGVINSISKLSLDAPLQKNFYYLNEKASNEMFSVSLLLRLLTSSILVLLALIILMVYDPLNLSTLSLYFLIAAASFYQFDIFENIYFSLSQGYKVAIVRLLIVILSFSIKIMMISLGFPKDFIIATLILEPLFYFIFYSFLNRKRFFNFQKISYLKKYFEISDIVLLSFSSICFFLLLYFERIFLGWFAPSKELGIYFAGVKVVDFMLAIPMILSIKFFPALVQSQDAGKDSLRKNLDRFYTVMNLSGATIAVTLFFISPFLVKLFGSEYTESTEIAKYYSIIIFFYFISVARGRYLILQKEYKLLAKIAALTLFVSIIYAFILIPSFGAFGAVLCSIFTHISFCLIPLFFKGQRDEIIRQFFSFTRY